MPPAKATKRASTPGMGFEIPMDLLKEFRTKPRVVIKLHSVIGVPAPDFLKPGLLDKVNKAGYDVVLVPKAAGMKGTMGE